MGLYCSVPKIKNILNPSGDLSALLKKALRASSQIQDLFPSLKSKRGASVIYLENIWLTVKPWHDVNSSIQLLGTEKVIWRGKVTWKLFYSASVQSIRCLLSQTMHSSRLIDCSPQHHNLMLTKGLTKESYVTTSAAKVKHRELPISLKVLSSYCQSPGILKTSGLLLALHSLNHSEQAFKQGLRILHLVKLGLPEQSTHHWI